MERVAKFINGILGKKAFDVYEYEEEKKMSLYEFCEENKDELKKAGEEMGFKSEEEIVKYVKEVVRPAVYEKMYGKKDCD